MSKIGRKGIPARGVDISIVGNVLSFKGKESSGSYEVPSSLSLKYEEGMVYVVPAVQAAVSELSADVKEAWGLHRALLASKLAGAAASFERQVTIVGLGFKALPKGTQLECSLGYSHKIMFDIPQGVSVSVDKTGQKISLKSADAELVGLVASRLRALRPPEPYKGTGVMYAEEIATLRRKEGKKK